MTNKTKYKSRTCPECGITFRSKKKMLGHRSRSHIQEKDIRWIKCEYCGKIFSGKNGKRKHELTCNAKKE